MSTSAPSNATRQLLDQLRRQMDSVVGRRTAEMRGEIGQSHFSTGVAALDRLLPEGGLRRGTLIEWLGVGGGSLLAMLAARHALVHCPGRRLVIVQSTLSTARLYPPEVTAWGLSLDSVAWLHAANRSDQWWAFDQGLRSSAVAAVLMCLDTTILRDDRMFRRWQLAAEESGAVGLIVRSKSARNQPSWSDVRWLIHGCRVVNLSYSKEAGSTVVESRQETSQEVFASYAPRWRFDVECLRNSCVGTTRRVVCDLATGSRP